MAEFKLTELEREILNHRLEVPDAIAGALSDDDGLDGEVVEDVAGALLASLSIDDVYAALCAAHGRVLVDAVLKDAVAGSTYFGAATGEFNDGAMSQQKLTSIYAAGERLAEKIGSLIEDATIEFPNY